MNFFNAYMLKRNDIINSSFTKIFFKRISTFKIHFFLLNNVFKGFVVKNSFDPQINQIRLPFLVDW